MGGSPQLASGIVFVIGVALCVWRVRQADRLHVILCLLAAGLWIFLLVVNPRSRTLVFGIACLTFLVFGLSQPFLRGPDPSHDRRTGRNGQSAN